MNREIAVTIQNLVQYYSIKNGLEEISRHGIKVDIYVPIIANPDYNNMYNNTALFLEKENHTVFREYNGKNYKIALEADYMDDYFVFNSDYIIKYKYGVSVKPKLSFQPYHNLIFDAILCYSTYEQEILSNFAETFLIGNLKFTNYVHNTKFKLKKTVLYMPTYNSINNINRALEEFDKYKTKYNLIIKLHHGTSFLEEEKAIYNKSAKIFKKVFDHSVSIADIINDVDVVISDNSGSIFEAIYSGVPVGVLTQNINDYNYGNIEPLQNRYIKKGIIPYSNNFSDLGSVIKNCLSKKTIEKQLEVKKALFPLENSELLSNFWSIINKFLNSTPSSDRIQLKKNFIKEYYNYANYFNNIVHENKYYKECLEDKEKQIIYYKKIIEENKFLKE